MPQEVPDQHRTAEESFIKTNDIYLRYGTPGSIRVDVYERTRDGSVCVYDMKTGTGPLTAARMREMSETILSKFGDARRVLVTEVPTPR
jgi:hypothetical protein